MSFIYQFFKWSMLQITALIITFFAFGVCFFAILLPIIFLFQNSVIIDVLDGLFFHFVILVLMLVYAIVWYKLLFLASQENENLMLVALFSLIPNIILTTLWLPALKCTYDPYSCAFLPSRFIFFCFAFSVLLLPIYFYILKKWIYPAQSTQLRILYLVLCWFVLLLILAIIIVSISLFVVDVWAFLIGF